MFSSSDSLQKQNSNRSLEEVGNKVFKVSHKKLSYYIKSNRSGYPDVMKEYKAYGELRHYLHMPNVHLSNIEKIPVLFTTPASGESLFNTTKSLEELKPSLDKLLADISKLWKVTKSQNKSFLVRDCIKVAINTGQRILDNENVNQKLEQTLRDVTKSLNSINLPFCVLGHGDEHCGNIFVDSINQNYTLIDPNSCGYYLPIDLLNVLIGSYYLFEKDYSNPNDKKEQIVKYISSRLILILEEMFQLPIENSGLPQILFINLIRGYYGYVNPKNRIVIGQKKEFYLPIAFELLNNIKGP